MLILNVFGLIRGDADVDIQGIKGGPQCKHVCTPVKFFSKLNKFIFGYFDPVNKFFVSKNK